MRPPEALAVGGASALLGRLDHRTGGLVDDVLVRHVGQLLYYFSSSVKGEGFQKNDSVRSGLGEEGVEVKFNSTQTRTGQTDGQSEEIGSSRGATVRAGGFMYVWGYGDAGGGPHRGCLQQMTRC